MYAGNIKPHKNLERLIEAFHTLRRGGLEHVKLLIIGDEISKYATLRRAVHRHKLHKHVRFFGFVPDKTLASLYRLASVFVFPSLYEGFGLPPLEAMAAGTPVVTSNVSSLPEVVGDAALLIDPYEPDEIAAAMRRVLTEPALRDELRARGLARVKEFSWERSVRRVHDIYREVHRRVKVALVHDWLTGMRGGEKVLEAICELYPEAPLLHAGARPWARSSPTIEAREIRTSFVQRLPQPARFYRHYLPLFPAAVAGFDLRGYDLVISSSHCAVKSVVVPDGTHVCYCHSPMRYAWDQFDAYFGPAQVGQVRSRLIKPVMDRLAGWDARTAHRVNRFLSNSQYVAGRIRRYYNRGSTVVYPPVDTEYYRPDPGRATSGTGALVVSALVPYKRLDLAIAACRTAGVPLRIVGQGPEATRLRTLAAGADVTFLGWRPDDEIRALYREAVGRAAPRRPRISGSCRSKRRPAAPPWWRSARGAPARR